MEMVSPFFQILPLSMSIAAIAGAIYWRLLQFKSVDKQPTILPVTPTSLQRFGGSPRIVKVGLYINQFQAFDMTENNFVFSGIVWFEFNRGTISLDTLKRFTIEKGEILQQSPADTQVLKDTVLVKYAITVKFTSALNYQDFPFDSHQLFIYLTLPSVSPSEIIFESSAKDLSVKPVVHTYGWQLVDTDVIAGYRTAKLDPYNPEKSIHYPAVIFTLNYRRYGIRFVLLISLPIIFMFYLAMFSFSIDDIRSSISIAVGSITAILAYRFVIEKLSPQTGYFLLSDYLFFIFLFGSFFVFMLNILENFIFTQMPLIQKKILLILAYIIVTVLTLYTLIGKGRKKKFLLSRLFFSGKKWRFDTIVDLKQFALQMPADAPMDTTDAQNPDYTTFYLSLQPSLLRRLFSFIHDNQIDTLPVSFISLLETITQQREQNKQTGRFITRIVLRKPARFIIWGDLHASFHSLYQSLNWLQQQQYINEDLMLTADDLYLVFNGDSISRGAYNIETLFTILLLMQKNQDHVFYIRGQHEDAAYWHDFSLKDELIIRAKYLSQEQVPFNNLFMRFFDTLPLALYISMLDNPTDLIRISHERRLVSQVDELTTGTFFASNKPDITFYDLTRKEEIPQKITVKAIIETEDWMHERKARHGLGLLDQEHGATAWSIVSAPTIILQQEYDYFYEAFVILQINNPISESTISLINKDIRTKEPFVQHEPMNIITGRSITHIKLKSEITIGSTMALVGGVSSIGQSTKHGMSVSINKVNKAGGINGYHIKTIIYNDDYTPFLARQNINRLMQVDETRLMLLPIGGPTLDAYIDYVREGKVTVFFPVTGAPQFRDPTLYNLINLRASYTDEVYALINYIHREYTAQKFAFFYEDDTYGLGPLNAAHKVLKKRGITQWIDIPYARATSEFTEQIQQIKQAQPDAIGLFCTAHAAQEFIRQIGIEHILNKKLFAISFAGEESLRLFAKQHGINILFASVVPNPHASKLKIVQEYRTAMDENGYNYNNFSLEAYIATRLIINVLEQIDKPPFSPDKIMNQLESFNQYRLQGLTFTFNAQRRDLSPDIWLETSPEKEWLRIPFKKLKQEE